ncbi:T9SS type A sorting domain-containing protein [bacterium SCSIO 12643]|nr:T9SS type A sorting domain-containing protein [bacterium SCSIO 12643]
MGSTITNKLLLILPIICTPVLLYAQDGPGGIGSKDGSSNLKVWLNADDINANDDYTDNPSNNAKVSTWYDLSGNSNDYSSSGNNRPKFKTSGSLNYLRFNASSSSAKYMSGPSSGTYSDASAYFVVKPINSGLSSTLFDGPSYSLRVEQYSNTNKVGYTRYGVTDYSSSISSPYGIRSIFSFHKPGGSSTISIRVNGSENFVNMGLSSAGFPYDRIGKNSSGADEASGDFFEVILFNDELSAVQKVIIDNYLSSKYGNISIINDYYSQDNASAGSFDYHVAGIGKATDGSSHTTSKGSGIVTISNPSDLQNDEYLFWGEDTKTSTHSFTTSGNYTERQNSTWRVSKRNDIGSVTVAVDATDLDLSGKQSCAALYMVVSSSSSFSSKTRYPMTLSSGTYTATGVSFNDNDYFTFEYFDQIVVDNSQFYNGSGSSSVPNTTDACYKLLVKNSATGSLPLTENAVVREIEVESGGVLTINSGIYVSLAGDIVNNGTINIEENTSLIQTGSGTDNNSGSGIYNVKRAGNNSSFIYNIWASPIQAATLTSVFSSANPCDIWTFDKDNQAWKYDFAAGYSTTCNGNSVTFSATDVITGGDGIMDIGGGYFVPGNPTALKTYNGDINNGDIQKAITTTSLGNPGGTDWADDDWNLLGNPYPSALNATAFWNENAVNNSRITDALYFWDEADTSGGYNQNSDYASWNLSGGVNSGNSLTIPGGNIASGQGFWVVANTNTNVVFNNSMRSSNNSQFFKTQKQINQHNAWVSFTSPSGYQNNILVGYNQTTTDAFDVGYDAHKLVGNSHVRFASYIGTDEYVIQSVAPLSIGDSKTIPLVVFSDEAGLHEFNEYKRENLPGDFKIFLRDKTLGIDHNLVNGPYSVDLLANTEYNNRFELVFKNEIQQSGGGAGSKGGGTVTSIEDTKVVKFKLVQNSESLTISHPDGINGDIMVIDITGKILFHDSNVFNKNSISISWSDFSSGAYFITIQNNEQRVFFKQVVK